jgi:hypothetical protein
MSFLSNPNQKSYLSQIMESVDFDSNKDVMEAIHAGVDPDMIAFLNKCLVFNP